MTEVIAVPYDDGPLEGRAFNYEIGGLLPSLPREICVPISMPGGFGAVVYRLAWTRAECGLLSPKYTTEEREE